MQALMHEPTKASARESVASATCRAFSTLDIAGEDHGRITIFWRPGEAQIIADAINSVLAARGEYAARLLDEAGRV